MYARMRNARKATNNMMILETGLAMKSIPILAQKCGLPLPANTLQKIVS